MNTLTRATLGLVVGMGAIAALNHSGVSVPALEWVRVDTLLAKFGMSQQAPSTETADATGKAKRGQGASSGGGGRRFGQDGPVPVVVAKANLADVPVYLRGVGSARAMNTVTVRPQVDGKLLTVEFREGQDVKRGDLLALIDPTTYQASLDQANAKLKLTQALLSNAELDLDRYTKTGPGVVAQKTVDTQRSQVTQLQAQLKSDAAAIASAEAVLAYTRITSPIDGRTGQRLVDEGNLVRSGDAGIVTIAQIKPIAVQFTLPQQQLAQVSAAQKIGPVSVEAMDADDKTVLDTGALTFIDNQIDQTTGSVKMKADLSNDRLQLWPGQFANVRVRVDVLRDAITVPTAAVQRGPQGTFVFVAVETKRGEVAKTIVAVRPVTVAQQDDRLAVLTKGLDVGETIVTSGFARLKDQTDVTITRTEGAAPTPAAPAQGPTSAAPETGAIPGNPPPDRLRRAEGERDKSERRGKRDKSQESSVQ